MLSRKRCQIQRGLRDILSKEKFAHIKSDKKLEFSVYRHNSLIRRRLDNVDMDLQENKAVNLSIAAPKINFVLIRPGETFSFWHLVGSLTLKKGYLKGLTISSGRATSGIGGGMCQLTNLIHWMVLHSDLEITEHHHHDQFDLFPDFNRTVPFGTGTSILYNYLDYRFVNHTDITYQLIVYTTEEYLCGELRSDKKQANKYHIISENVGFTHENGVVYRNGEIYREKIDRETGNCIEKRLIRKNHAKVMYDTSKLQIDE
ncbi:MAG: VanW family protein [Clostridiales bacterium]|nr:VanW family protein [Clostridiales bacterium]